MHKRNSQPAWWQMYLIVAGGLGLMLLDAKAPFSTVGHEVTECAILFLMYGLIALWLHMNKLGLLQMPDEDAREQDITEGQWVPYVSQTFRPDAMANHNADSNCEPDQDSEPLSRQLEREQV